jgi:hypothetical protein
LLLGAHPAAAQSKTFNQTVPLSAGGSLTLHAGKGSVKMMAWDRDQVEIRARIEADSSPSPEAARRAVDATRVDVATFGSRVVIRSRYENTASATSWIFGHRTPDIHYEIRAPKRIDLRLEIDRSDTVLTGFEGRMDLDFDRSEIEGNDLTGDLRLSIDRGGDSIFRNVRGAVRIDSDRTNLRIDFARLDQSSRIEIDRGDAEVSIARGQGFTLDTSLSRRANFDTNLPVETDRSSSRDRRNPSGSFNGGGPRLSIEADRSHIRLRS